MKILYLILTFTFAIPVQATIRTIPCSGTITSSVQSAINSSTDGDIVNIEAGSCSLESVSWTDKNITVQGQGIDVTTLTFNSGGITLINDSTTERKGFRLDHVKFVTMAATSSGMHRPIRVQGLLYGVIYSNIFNINHRMAGNTFEPYLNSEWPGLMGVTSWSKSLGLGTDSAVYMEDNTFTFTSGSDGGSFVVDGGYGMRLVFRHNTVTDGYYMSHWYEGNRRGPVKNEIYENKFNSTGAVSTMPRPIWLGGGTGVIFNNTVSGTGWWTKNIVLEDKKSCNNICNGSDANDGNMAGESGWPCSDQIGRGVGALKSQPTVPLYVWNNGNTSVELQEACLNRSLLSAHVKTSVHSNGDKDYCVGSTTMPGSCGNHQNTFTPYTYPHPITLAGGPEPLNSPTNLRILP
jgi:hypothetical protein